MNRICPSWLSFMLYNPIRLKFTDREKILDESGVTSESVVLEVGAGNGFLTEAIALRAKKLVCIDIQEGMIKKLRKRMAPFGDNVEIIQADIVKYRSKTAYADVALLYYSYHEISNKNDAVMNIREALRNKGVVSLYEPTVEVGKKAMQRGIAMFEEAGCVLEQQHTTLFTRFARLRKTERMS